ncbi:MAG: ribose-phosphate diphosphokinase [bacterium]|nr:ribose-phosphate diphosphokinase [bacterium]
MKVLVGWQKDVLGSKSAVKVKVVEFANGEFRTWVDPLKIKQREVVVKVRFYPNINRNLILTLLTVDGLKRAGAKKIRLEALWFPYSPQNKVFVKGEPLSMKLTVDLLEAAGVDEFVVYDIHHIESLSFFSRPVVHLSFLTEFVRVLRPMVDKDWVVISPDCGGGERAEKLAKILGLKWGYFEKQRSRLTGKIRFFNLKGVDVMGKNGIIVDDFSATGGTILKVAEKLKEGGAGKIVVCLSHLLMDSQTFAKVKRKGLVDEWVVGMGK